MAIGEIVENNTHFAAHRPRVERNDVSDKLADPFNVRTRRLPCEMEGTHNNPARIGVEPQIMLE